MQKSITLTRETIQTNIQKLQNFLQGQKLDAFYVSSFDSYLNEYVPMEDCHRYYVTGFTGSVAEVLVPRTGKVRLYIDGRYFEQADLEVNPDVVEVVKCQLSLRETLLKDLETLSLKKLGLEADRTPFSFSKTLEQHIQTYAFYKNELAEFIAFHALPAPKKITFIPRVSRGRDTLEKTRQIFQHEKQGLYLTALDSIAWVSNCRGYHLPNLSSFRSKALLTLKQVYIFISKDTPLSKEAEKIDGVTWVHCDAEVIPSELDHLQNQLHLEELIFDSSSLNAADYNMLVEIFGEDKLKEKKGALIEFQSIKEPLEVQAFEDSFAQSNKAIFNTIKWVKESIKENKKITEYDLYLETSKKYEEQKAKELSFGTIAGVGPNGSIIHYGNPSPDVVIKKDDMILLDSGGYFESGFATDTTRTFLASIDGKPDPKCVEIYTLTLKGLIQAESAVFPEGTKGIVIDGLARASMMKYGYNYNHGTGHGVGIHVHEDGVRLSPLSQLPMKVGQVVSIEPGIYIPGFGGVRLENVALVEAHPTFKGFLKFRTFTYVGFDYRLIDMSLLTHEEKTYLEKYEAECLKRGNSLTQIR